MLTVKKLTKKQKREFAIHYIVSSMLGLDGDNFGGINDLIDPEDIEDILTEICKKALIIGGNRRTFSSLIDMLKHVQNHF